MITKVNNAYLLDREYYAAVVRLDPFQDAVPCFQRREYYPLSEQWQYEINRGLTQLGYSRWIQEVKDSRE